VSDLREISWTLRVKVTEQDLLLFAYQHILWLEIQVQETLIVDILHRPGQLRHKGQNLCQGETASPGKALTQGTAGRIFHHQVGPALARTVLEERDNVRVLQASEQTGCGQKALLVLCALPGGQYLERSRCFEIDVLGQEHAGLSSTPQQMQQAIVAYLRGCLCAQGLLLAHHLAPGGGRQTRTVLSALAEAISSPAGDQTSALTAAVCAV
jgi:hypothetical protein